MIKFANPIRFLSIAAIAILITISFSCSDDFFNEIPGALALMILKCCFPEVGQLGQMLLADAHLVRDRDLGAGQPLDDPVGRGPVVLDPLVVEGGPGQRDLRGHGGAVEEDDARHGLFGLWCKREPPRAAGRPSAM